MIPVIVTLLLSTLVSVLNLFATYPKLKSFGEVSATNGSDCVVTVKGICAPPIVSVAVFDVS